MRLLGLPAVTVSVLLLACEGEPAATPQSCDPGNDCATATDSARWKLTVRGN